MPLGSPASSLSCSLETMGGPASFCSMDSSPPTPPHPTPTPRRLPSAPQSWLPRELLSLSLSWLPAFVLPVPPGQPGPSSCLAHGSTPMAPGPGSQARIPQLSWARQAGSHSAPSPTTLCLVSRAEGPVLFVTRLIRDSMGARLWQGHLLSYPHTASVALTLASEAL